MSISSQNPKRGEIWDIDLKWQTSFEGNFWHVPIQPSALNGLTKSSAADALQVRSLSLERFVKCRGRATKQELEEIVQALAAVVEFS